MGNGFGVASMISLGIIGIILGIPLGILAIIFGAIGMSRKEKYAKAGFVMGIIDLVLGILLVIFVFSAFFGMLASIV